MWRNSPKERNAPSLAKIGRRCRAGRLERELRAADVSTMTGYSVPTVCAFERGERDCARLLAWYIVVLGVNLDGTNTY